MEASAIWLSEQLIPKTDKQACALLVFQNGRGGVVDGAKLLKITFLQFQAIIKVLQELQSKLMLHTSDILLAGRKHAVKLNYFLRKNREVDKLIDCKSSHFGLRAILQEDLELQFVLSIKHHPIFRVRLMLLYELVHFSCCLSQMLGRKVFAQIFMQRQQLAQLLSLSNAESRVFVLGDERNVGIVESRHRRRSRAKATAKQPYSPHHNQQILKSNHSKQSFISHQSFIIATMSFLSSQNLRQNIPSDDRLVDFARKSAKPYSSDPRSSTPRTTIDNRDSSISWQQKYQKARGLFNQQSVIEKQEEEEKSQVYKKSEAKTHNENNQSQPLDTIMKNIPEPTNSIFKTNRNLDQYPSSDEPNRQSFQHGQNLNVSQINISLKPMNEIQQHYFNAIRSDRDNNTSQLDSSENIFETYKKKALMIEEKQSNANNQESQNIFEAINRKSKPPTLKDDSSSDQSENLFENMKRPKEQPNSRNSLIKSQEVQKYPLEMILQSTKLYHNYLIRTSSNDKKLLKKFSLDIPQLKQTYMPNMKIPNHYFFKPERVQFKKLTDELIGQASYNGNQYLCRVNTERSSFYYQDLRSEQLKNLNGVKSSKITLDKNDRISPHTEYDHIYQRFYLFSNRQQAILVYSQLSMELLCRVPVQKHIINPNLHFCQINGRNFLMLVGGYISVQKQIAQGSNFIQIFQVNKWYLDLRSRVIKLIIGRINPIFISLKDKKQHIFLILGGNTIARVSSLGVFDFQYEKEINQSTNMTGISIDCREITELFDYDQHTSISNLSVKLEDPFLLHSGVVLNFSNNFLLVLPHSLNLFQIKISNKEINIIQARAAVFFHTAQTYQKRELSLKIERENLIVYRIDDRGMFRIQSHEGKKVEKCFCQLY